MNKTLCIYHGNCADGFGAAWAVWKALGDDVELVAGHYGSPPPDVAGRDVVLADFSYKRPVLAEMAEAARSILVLDHHKSAAEDLARFGEDLTEPVRDPHWLFWQQYLNGTRGGKALDHCGVVFDMDRSGAMIAWEFFHPGKAAPQLIEHIQDRDLWRFELAGTREINSALRSYPFDLELWSTIVDQPIEELWNQGEAIDRKHRMDVASLVAASKRSIILDGHCVPVANVPPSMASDAGHLMCNSEWEPANGKPPFAATYYDGPSGRAFSLRSTDEGEDVQAIAVKFHGGGHRNAAGFLAIRGWEGDDL